MEEKNFSIESAVLYLESKGYPISISKLRTIVNQGKINHVLARSLKSGRMVVSLEQTELDRWVANQKVAH